MKYLSKHTKKLSIDTKQISRCAPLMMKTVFLLPCNQGNNYTTASCDGDESHEAAAPTFRQILLHVVSLELKMLATSRPVTKT